MRCFIAIDIDEPIREGLRDLQRRIERDTQMRRGEVKWVQPEAIHLTLKFLGEIKDSDLVGIFEVVKEAAGQHSAFDMEVGTVGCFGGSSARVLWVGAGQDCEALQALQEDLENRLAEAGWPVEARKFTGHLTLCRIKNAKAGEKLAQVAQQYSDVELGRVQVDSVIVYESRLQPQGPTYTPLGSFKLMRDD